ncbi:MAG: ABC transporter substrate-binding protein, partial [Deltaproteobacteria bacterium]|nr:ABC transporter substrate-binding protein [Deltaproteobacteria bacterium]
MKDKRTLHPAIYDLKVDMDKGKITRRDFLRYSTLLGMSAFAASQMAGLGLAKKAFAATPKRGGVLKVVGQVQKITHPAQFSWVAPSNIGRQVAEYLSFTDGKNITHPYLLKNWVVSDDLKTWTLNLRQGVKWNNGDTFTSDDVIFTFNQWMNKDVGSSMLGLVGEYM